jgi:hypothetical protein
MKASKKSSSIVLVPATLLVLASSPSQLFAGNHPAVAQWDLRVDTVESGEVNIGSDFEVAIYENLLKELAKTKRYGRVFRDGDRNANGVHNLLILKITVESYTPGSEAKRAVTTVAGATKLKVLSKLSTQEGQVVLERFVSGNVRFFGGNLRATHDLAHNVAKAIEQSTLPVVPVSDSEKVTEPTSDVTGRSRSEDLGK